MTDLTLAELDLAFCRRNIPGFAEMEAARRAADEHRDKHNAESDTGRRPQSRLLTSRLPAAKGDAA